MPTADATRRELLAAGAALVFLAGCGDDDPAATDAAMRTVDTDRGPVRVPLRPTRIACGDFYGAFQVVDLGLTPVGISGGTSETEPYATQLEGVKLVGDYEAPDAERVAATRPDLILRTIDTGDALYRRLSGIAPTVEISFQQLSLLHVTRRVGDVLNRAAQATALTDRYTARAQAIEDEHGALLRRTRWGSVSPAAQGQFFLQGPGWTDNAVLMEAGVQLGRAAMALTEPVKPYSLERLDLLDDCDVLVVVAAEDGSVEGAMEPIVSNPLWERLPAVRAGRVLALPSGTSSLGMGLGLLDALEAGLQRL